MKKVLFILSLAALVHSNLFAEGLFSLDILKKETASALSKNANLVTSSQDEGSAFASYVDGQANYQFTLSGDKEPQAFVEEKVMVADRECSFFRPMGDSSGALFIPLKNEKGSLVVILMYGMFSDENVSAADIKAIADKIEISLFD